jgi:two-component system aerobic respiration control protein ArcA
MRVLIVDDSDIATQAMGSLLSSCGHEIVTSASAIGVSTLIVQHNIDVAIIDVGLTSFQGDRLVDVLRKQRRLDKVGIVLVSGQPRATVEALAASSGADMGLCKKEIDRLPRAVKEAHEARNARANPQRPALGSLSRRGSRPGSPSFPP